MGTQSCELPPLLYLQSFRILELGTAVRAEKETGRMSSWVPQFSFPLEPGGCRSDETSRLVLQRADARVRLTTEPWPKRPQRLCAAPDPRFCQEASHKPPRIRYKCNSETFDAQKLVKLLKQQI